MAFILLKVDKTGCVYGTCGKEEGGGGSFSNINTHSSVMKGIPVSACVNE